MFIFPELWLIDVVPYIYVFSSPGLFFSHTIITNSGVGFPVLMWNYWAVQSGPGSPSAGLALFLAYISQLPHAQCSPTWEPSPAQVVVICDPVQVTAASWG